MQRRIQEALRLASTLTAAYDYPAAPAKPREETLAEQVARIRKEFEIDTNYHSHPEKLERFYVCAKEYPPNSIDLFDGKMMTYPVILDNNDGHVVDFLNLCKWWSNPETPENRNINPYTFEPLKTLRIHQALKKSLDDFVARLRLPVILCKDLPVLPEHGTAPKP